MRRLVLLALAAALFAPMMAVAAHPADNAGQPPAQPPAQPVSFSALLADFMTYSEDVMALRSWFENLDATEQQSYADQYKAALDKLAGQEDGLFQAITAQMDCSCSDSNLYTSFNTIKSMEPIKARKIFSSLVGKLSQRINHDYVNNPSNADMARRARDLQAVRSYIGYQG